VTTLREKKKQGLREYFLQKVREEGQTVFSATYQEIAAKSGVSLGTVVKGLRILEQEGFLRIRRGPSRRVPNSYAVLISGRDPNRTLGEDLAELSRREEALRQQVADLSRRLARHEALLDRALVSAELPGGLHLLLVPEEAYRGVLATRHEEERLLRRLLDRRGIGAGLRRLAENPRREAAEAFARRLERRLAATPIATPRLEAAASFIRETLLTLPTAEDLPAAVREATARYEAFVAEVRSGRPGGDSEERQLA
jgi:DNA-binding transcriptional regulator YhcF (GntR family)